MPVRLVKGPANKYGRAAGVTDVTGNPFANPYFARGTSASLRVELYRHWIQKGDSARAVAARGGLQRLRGRDLACTCPLDLACHADVLLELANA